MNILFRINPKFKLIIQGTSTEKYFKDYYDSNFDKKKDEIIIEKGNKLLFRRRYLKLNDYKVPTVILPHASKQNSYFWKEIEKEEISSQIKTKLKEFNFLLLKINYKNPTLLGQS